MITPNQIPVSVVIPTYNRPAYLRHCLNSLFCQTTTSPPFEVVIVTDGPDLNSKKVVAEFMNIPAMQVRLLSLPEKKGPAAARNLGWKSAKGELIIFTDDDCLAGSGFIHAYLSAYCQQEDPLAAFTGKIIVPLPDVPTDYENNTAQLAVAEFVTANCACSKAALRLVQGFDEAFTMAWREDSDLQFKFIDNHISVTLVEDAVIVHPVRKASWGVSIKEQKKTMFNALLQKRHPILFRKKIYKGPLWNYYAMNIALMAVIVLLLLHKFVAAFLVFFGWTLLLFFFAFKRLQNTRRSPDHIAEMIVTSAIIPSLSVFWTLYGSWRYKTLVL